MKIFFKKTFLFVLLILLSGFVIRQFVPYHWGNVWYSTKIRKLELEPEKYNTFFFGSSRVYRQIDPIRFDSLVHIEGKTNIHSFNLGAPATFCPQIYFLYEKFLEDTIISHNAKYVFLELMDIDMINPDLIHQERVTYWQNLNDLQFVFKAVAKDSKIPAEKKYTYYKNYSISWIENKFNMGHFRDYLMNKNYYDPIYLGSAKNGFYPLEEEYALSTNTEVKESLDKNRLQLHMDTKQLQVRKESSVKLYTATIDKPNSIHFARIMELIKRSDQRHIRLIFFVSPRNVSREIASLYNAIPLANRLEAANAKENPEFYEVSNSFDIGHMNTAGAREYSSVLANKFIPILENPPSH